MSEASRTPKEPTPRDTQAHRDGGAFPVFYSWQSDMKRGRNVIERELRKGLRAVARETGVDLEMWKAGRRAGAVAIADTILEDISRSECLVADVSIINGKRGKHARPVPNPNVVLEVGWGAKALCWERIILVHNLDTAPLKQLPFDLLGRAVVPFSLAAEERGEHELQDRLRVALRGVVQRGRVARGAAWITDAEWAFRRGQAGMDLHDVDMVLDLFEKSFATRPLSLPPYSLATGGLRSFLEVAWLELQDEDAAAVHFFIRDAEATNHLAARIPVGTIQGGEPTLAALQDSLVPLRRWASLAKAIVDHAQRHGRPRVGQRMTLCPAERPYILPQVAET